MYTVLMKCTEGDSVLYAVASPNENEEPEFLSAEDLKLLAYVGLEMQTPKGDKVTMDGDNLVCDVEEFEPPEEPQEMSQEEIDMFDWDSAEDDVGEGDTETEEEDGDFLDEDVEEDPDDSEEDFEDIYAGYDIDADDGGTQLENDVSRLYKLLNPDQLTVLRRYYLWYSQRLFSDAQKGGMRGFKSKVAAMRKRATLNQLRGDGDFRYAGWLDTGSIDAGYTCTLGHRLRYMHIAWDITVGDIETTFFGENYNADYQAIIDSNECIIFGINCMGDFFEVDEECIKSLKRAQADSLKDMQLMYKIMTTENVQAVMASFDLLDGVLKIVDRHDMKLKMLKDAEPTIPFSVVAFYHQFRSAGMVPPKSLVQEIRSCLVGWTDGRRYFSNKWTGMLRYPEESFYDRLKVIAKKKNEGVVNKVKLRSHALRNSAYVNGIDKFVVYCYLLFTYEICGYYKYTATKEGFHDEGGYSKNAVTYPLESLYRRSIHNIYEGMGFDMQSLTVLFDLMRVAIEAEQKYGGSDSDYKLQYFSMGKMYEESFCDGNSYGITTRMRSIINGYCKVSGRDSNDVYRVINCMNDMVFGRLGTVSVLCDKGLMRYHSDFKSCIVGNKLDIASVYATFVRLVSEFDTLYADMKTYASSVAQADQDAYNKKQEEENRLKEEQRKAQEAQAQQAQAQAQQAGVALPTTRLGVVQYLNAVGVSQVTDKKLDFAKQVLDTLTKNGKEPSPRQFQYLQPLYEAVAGVPYAGADKAPDKVDLSSRKDIQDAIAWVNADQRRAKAAADAQGVDDFQKLVSILGSIQRYGKISERQMKYAEQALAMYQSYNP